ncbi:MAG: hypothetical protein JO061_05815 [Acidobacteriaceae bacterium]|nr:hypothetical protein [Acidobacteriaceae bacterium]
MTVTYSKTGKVCAIQIQSGVGTAQEIGRALEQAVPSSERGNRWTDFKEYSGVAGFMNTYYEHVIITEDIFTPNALNKKPGARVIFKDKECGWKPGSDPFDTPPRAAASPEQ